MTEIIATQSDVTLIVEWQADSVVIIEQYEDTLIVEMEPGVPGLSAYQVALNNGFEGTEEEWLASLEWEPWEPWPLVDHNEMPWLQWWDEEEDEYYHLTYAQLWLVDSAIQPGDNISDLFDDVGYWKNDWSSTATWDWDLWNYSFKAGMLLDNINNLNSIDLNARKAYADDWITEMLDWFYNGWLVVRVPLWVNTITAQDGGTSNLIDISNGILYGSNAQSIDYANGYLYDYPSWATVAQWKGYSGYLFLPTGISVNNIVDNVGYTMMNAYRQLCDEYGNPVADFGSGSMFGFSVNSGLQVGNIFSFWWYVDFGSGGDVPILTQAFVDNSWNIVIDKFRGMYDSGGGQVIDFNSGFTVYPQAFLNGGFITSADSTVPNIYGSTWSGTTLWLHSSYNGGSPETSLLITPTWVTVDNDIENIDTSWATGIVLYDITLAQKVRYISDNGVLVGTPI